jgi:hypothetical protein
MQVATFKISNVVENKVLSNANFYGINTVQEADIFRNLFRHAYLNPTYSLMTRAINGTDAFTSLMSANLKQTLILSSNSDLNAAGYDYDTTIPAWSYTATGAARDVTGQATTRMNRLVQTSVLLTPNGEFDNVASGRGIAETIHGEYVTYNAGKLQAAGNVVDGSFVTVGTKRLSFNGTAYPGNGVLKFAENSVNLGRSLETLALSTDPNVKNRFSHFFDYLKNTPATFFNNTNKEIFGVDAGVFYTALIPTNVAIEAAVRAGILPGVLATGVPRFTTASQNDAERQAVQDFIRYSIVSKATFAVDGKKAQTYQTLHQTNTGQSRLLTISYPTLDKTLMSVTDDAAVSPVTTSANYLFSNNLSNRALIHSINQVLKFK